MSTQLKFTPLLEARKDVITGEVIDNGYQLYVPFEIFQHYKFNARLKLYCSTCDFLKTPLMLHAWSMTYLTGKIVKKETHMNATEWAILNEIKQPSAIYWPEIQQSVIEEFSYCILMVVQPMFDSDIHEFVLEIDDAN